VNLLLDTHTFLWALGEPNLLSERVRELLLDSATHRWVSSVTLWEIAIKVQIGKLDMPMDRQFYLRKLDDLEARPLAVDLRHSLAMFELPPHHRDPFDRLLIAQAREDGLTIVTRDREFARYEVEIVW
jgi:PIN domain nuclease of toxin-antitoxin system